jgi:hypothetical protein
MSRRAASVAAISALALFAVGFGIHRIALDHPTGEALATSDAARYFHPHAVHLHDALREGSLPLWNPYQMAGMPLLATHVSGPMYPPNLLVLLALPPEAGLAVLGVLHVFLAGFFTWMFGRRLGLSNIAALGAAVAFAFSAEHLRTLYNPAYQATHSWLPAILWAVHGLATEVRLRWSAALGGALALSFLGGHAQGTLFSAQLGIAYGSALWLFGTRSGRSARVLALAVLGGAISIGLAAVQLLPVLELVSHTLRVSEGLTLEEVARYSAAPQQILGGLIGLGGFPFACTTLVVPLAAAGLWDRRRRRQWVFFVVAALVAALFALGPWTPMFSAYFSLPGGDLFRYPARVAIVYVFCVSVLVGLGVEGLRRFAAGRFPEPSRVSIAVAALVVAAVAGDLYSRSRLESALPLHRTETRGGADLLVEHLRERSNEGRVFIETFGWYHTNTTPYLLGMMNRIFVVPTYEPTIPGAYASWFGQGRLWRGFASTLPHSTPRFHFLRTANTDEMRPAHLRRLLDLMSVRFYAAHRELAKGRLADFARFVRSDSVSFGPIRLFERAAALPRVYAVHELVRADDASHARALVLAADFEPRREAVVESEVVGVSPAVGLDQASIRSYSPEAVTIEVRCESACLLVLTDLDFSGWEAKLDGAKVETHRVNGLFRGIVVPAGAHTIEYRYRSVAFQAGALVTALTLGGLVLAGWGSRRSRSVGRRARSRRLGSSLLPLL